MSVLVVAIATGAEETVSSSRQTLQQAIEPLALRSVMAWVTPTQGVPLWAFICWSVILTPPG